MSSKFSKAILTAALNRPKVRKSIEWLMRQMVTGQMPVEKVNKQIQQTFQTVEHKKVIHNFKPLNPDGSFVAEEERFVVEGGKVIHIVEKSTPITQSGEIVPTAGVIHLCTVCQQFSAVELFCNQCARGLCRLHARVIQEPGISGIYCPGCYEVLSENLNTWALADRKKQQTPPEQIKEMAPFQPPKRKMFRHVSEIPQNENQTDRAPGRDRPPSSD